MEPSQDLDPQAVQRAAERLWRQRWPEKVGRRHGATWALEVASYSDIMWVLGLREEVGTLVERIEQERPGFTEDWADDYEGLDETRAWRGFIEGVATVWERVQEQVDAK